MRLTAIGTGTAAPSPSRVQSGVLIETGEVRLLIDCGSGVVFRMAQLGIDWGGITHVALTHFHADHTNDLANLIFAWRYGMLPPRSDKVWLIGPVGLRNLLDLMAAAFGPSLLEALSPHEVREVAVGEVLALSPDVALEAFKVPHTDESVAYSVREAGARVVVSGDTSLDHGLADWASETDVLVLECSLPDALAIPTHLTPRQCGEVAAIAQPRLLALTHFYPPVESVDIESEVAVHFSGRVVRCTDGWTTIVEDS